MEVQQREEGRGESGSLAHFYICTFWVDGAETPLVRLISTSDPNPRAKKEAFDRRQSKLRFTVVGGGCSLRRNFCSSQILNMQRMF